MKWPAVIFFLINLYANRGIAQISVVENPAFDSIAHKNQQLALDMLSKEDTLSTSLLWPNIKPYLFFANIRRNILYPDKINQGAGTNFCGYAGMTHLLVKYHPDIYLQHIMSLYRNGKTILEKKELDPSNRVRQAAGTLKHRGELDVLHANQLWFLTLADQFKGYINIFDHKYNPGDETRVWAGSNYAKFNRMLEKFTNEQLVTAGSDFLRPFKSNFYDYITRQLNAGVVMLYVNSKFLYPHKFTLFKLRAPTHYIVLYDMRKVGDLTRIKYLDYGMKTEMLITRKRLRKLIFGVTTITRSTHETR